MIHIKRFATGMGIMIFMLLLAVAKSILLDSPEESHAMVLIAWQFFRIIYYTAEFALLIYVIGFLSVYFKERFLT